ncbi:MAG: hypothetical protein IJB96_11425 [Lachnospira sp.]|nr:hypothetical protein [Lachnospira sp.]
MAKCKSGKCGCQTRIVSNAVQNMCCNKCFDVCAVPECGSPSVLSLYAPLIYDEIGINLCTTFDLDVDISAVYPTATKASVQVVDIAYTYGEGGIEIDALPGRPNCYSVTLTNLTVMFAVNIYDDSCRLLTTLNVPAAYLPSEITAPTYDEDTNPASVVLEIFAPYGVSYNEAAGVYTPALNNIGFLSTNNYIRQGLNLYAIPKVLDFDITEDTLTVGLTVVLQSLYFAGYRVSSAGKINTPKGSIISPEDTDCMRFVAGDLLNLSIKPLDLGTEVGNGDATSCDSGCTTGLSCDNEMSCNLSLFNSCDGNCE